MRVQSPAATATFSGIGLFTGAPASVLIRPGAPSSGITFERTDRPHEGVLTCSVSNIPAPGQGPMAKLPSRNSVLSDSRACFIATVEHVLSALAALNISDAVVQIAGPEIPILDGSSAPIVEAILAAGLRDSGDVSPLILNQPVTVTDGKGGSITASPRPSPGAGYTYRLDYGPGAPIPAQTASWDSAAPAAADEYRRQVAPARTYCLLAEAQALRAAGLFKHVTPAEMLVIGDDARPIENTFRFDNEPARHKLLDLIGDLALVGRPVQADIVAHRGGHALNHQLCRAVLAAADGPAPS